jgi:hypothetical protein
MIACGRSQGLKEAGECMSGSHDLPCQKAYTTQYRHAKILIHTKSGEMKTIHNFNEPDGDIEVPNV